MRTRVYYAPEALMWVVEHPDCGTRHRFHEWRLALRIAVGHRCPPPPATVPAGVRVAGVRHPRRS